jgi:hypothetical protein
VNLVVEIAGFSPWWIRLLPSRWRARVLAENIRATYSGNMPPQGILMRVVPDGTSWILKDRRWPDDHGVYVERPFTLPEPPPKHDIRNRAAMGFSGCIGVGPIRAIAVFLAVLLGWVGCASPFLSIAEWIDSWRNEIRLMRGRGRRWDVERGHGTVDSTVVILLVAVVILLVVVVNVLLINGVSCP